MLPRVPCAFRRFWSVCRCSRRASVRPPRTIMVGVGRRERLPDRQRRLRWPDRRRHLRWRVPRRHFPPPCRSDRPWRRAPAPHRRRARPMAPAASARTWRHRRAGAPHMAAPRPEPHRAPLAAAAPGHGERPDAADAAPSDGRAAARRERAAVATGAEATRAQQREQRIQQRQHIEQQRQREMLSRQTAERQNRIDRLQQRVQTLQSQKPEGAARNASNNARCSAEPPAAARATRAANRSGAPAEAGPQPPAAISCAACGRRTRAVCRALPQHDGRQTRGPRRPPQRLGSPACLAARPSRGVCGVAWPRVLALRLFRHF